MYKIKKKSHAINFKKNKTYNRKRYIYITICIFIFFILLSIINIYSVSKQINPKHIIINQNHELLPEKPKNKWRYVQTLENL